MRTRRSLKILLAAALCAGSIHAADDPYPQGVATPQIASFLGADGFGTLHPDAPEQTLGLGRLVGLWNAAPEMRARDGSWAKQPPALWAWQYALDGFATQDLWFHSAEHLPAYLGALGRPYLLTGLRIFEPGSGKWRVAWAANGAGTAPGMDFGTFEGTIEGDDVVLLSEDEWGHQRITFSEITDSSFLWTSEMSRDGESWSAVMRVRAIRRY